MSLNLPNDSEGSPRICWSEATDAEGRSPYNWAALEKIPGLVRCETPGGDSKLHLDTFRVGKDLWVVAAQTLQGAQRRGTRSTFTDGQRCFGINK